MSSPITIPRYRTLPNTLSFVQHPLRHLMVYHREYGRSYYFYVGGLKRLLITTEPGLIRHVLQQAHRRYEKSELQTEMVAAYVGRGLITNTGADWRRQRRLIQPGFHRERLANLHRLMQGVVSQRADALTNQLQAGDNLDIYPHCLDIAFRIIGRTIYSDEVHDDQLDELSDSIGKVQGYLIKELRLPFLAWWFRLSGQYERHQQLARSMLDLQREQIRARQANPQPPQDLLQMLLDSRYEDTGEGMNEQQLVEEVIILFLAGHETSANALAWTFHLLSHHPESMERLRAELDRVCPGRPPTMQECRELTYLTQVLEESMRLYPPAWITDRKALVDDQYEDYPLPKDTIVSPFIYGLHHDPEFWPDPQRFDPDRFSAPAKQHRPPYTYLPFGGGPRLCIGNNFAMLEMQLVLAEYVRRFDFQPLMPLDAPVEALVTLRPRQGVRLKVQVRR
jgi:cytochrome P450